MTATTSLNITLTGTLQSTLQTGGADAYLVTLDSAGNATLHTLFDAHTTIVPGGLTVTQSLTLPVVSGKVYFVVQSPIGGSLTDLSTVIGQESDINWQNAASFNFRYDSFELTLQNSNTDAGNLTSVEGFGLPMAVNVSYTGGGSASLGYNASGADIFAAIAGMSSQAVSTWQASSPGLTGDRAALSPAQSVGIGASAFTAADWNGYITSLEQTDPTTQQPYANDIHFAGFVNPTVDSNGLYHNGGFYSYTLQWDAGNGIFWLAPEANSQIKGYIAIDPAQLANNIYATEGFVEIYQSQSDYAAGNPYIIYLNSFNGDPAQMNAGANNQWGDVVKQLLTGFTAGFYGVTGQNQQGQTVDLDQSWNWDPTYSFGSSLAAGQSPVYFDPYSAYFFNYSNSYGSGYSDQLMSYYAQGGPLLSLWDPAATGSVANIGITIFDDGETPTGYTTPVIYNYIAPGSGYVAPTFSTTSPANIVLSFTNGAMVLDQTAAEITFSFQTGDPNHPWASVTLDQSLDTTNNTLWQNWDIEQNPDGSYYATPQSTFAPQPAGTVLIGNLPVAASGVSWYQIEVSALDGSAAKTFNLYTTTSGSQFLDPNYAHQAGAIAVDGLATINADPFAQYVNTFTVNFLYSTTTTVDPSLLTQVNSNAVPSSVVIGQVTSDTPSASPGGGGFIALAGQSGMTGNSITTQDGQVGFGWTGLDNATGVPWSSWISGPTNKVDGQSVALVMIAGSNGSTVASIPIVADVDGQWVSGAAQTATLSNDTYTVTMQEYAASDTAYAHPLTAASSPTTLTVSLNDLNLDVAASGVGAFLVDDGSLTAGNWIRLETTGGSLPHGTTLVAYAVDGTGEMVSRDGLRTGVGLDEATLGEVGQVASDSGAALMSGGNSVYLQKGLELRFATVGGSGTIDLTPHVQTTERSDGGVQYQVNGLGLQAQVDNTLALDALMAGSQRSTNTPWVYVDHGDTIHVEVAGSCGSTNTLGFVHIDVDPTTGGWSVGGVAYGNTDAFRAAVVGSLDHGFFYRNGGEFHAAADWTVDGSSGLYAPVLLTQHGNVFVIGRANDDGCEHIRMFGENTFGIEDLSAAAGSDFDYNDMVVRISHSHYQI